MAPSQLQAAPTPRRCGRSEDKKDHNISVVDSATWVDLDVIVTVQMAAQRSATLACNVREAVLVIQALSLRSRVGKLPRSRQLLSHRCPGKKKERIRRQRDQECSETTWCEDGIFLMEARNKTRLEPWLTLEPHKCASSVGSEVETDKI